MKKVSPHGTFYPVVIFFLSLTFSVSCLANKPFDKSSARFLKQRNVSGIYLSGNSSLSVTAPADLAIHTDPWTNVASNVFLGNPVFSTVSGVSYTITNNAPSVFPIGITPITWTVTDNTGNSGTAIQNVTVTDNEKPYIDHMGEISVVNDAGKCGAAVSLITPYTYDNSGLPVSLTSDAPSFFSVGSTLIVWTATDAYGNSDTSSQVITVIDNEPPAIKIANVTAINDAGKCGAFVNLGIPETSDNCGVLSVTNDAPAFFPTGTTLVTWIVTDKAGYTNSAVQTVLVNDAEAPVFSGVPADVTVSCNTIAPVVTPTVTDNCDASPALSFSQTSTQVNNTSLPGYYNYTITRTWVAADISGNTATARQVITVADNTAPDVSVPANITVSNNLNVCGAVVKFAAVAGIDNCNSPVTILYSMNPGSVFPVGTTLVTVTAKDVSGNANQKSFTVKVNDTQKPLVSAPADIYLTVAKTTRTVTNLNLGVPVTSDNCGVKSVSNNAPLYFTVGTTRVTWTVKDNAGNTSSAIQKVTISTTGVTVKKTNEVGIDKPSNNKAALENSGAYDEIRITVAPNPSIGYFTLLLQSKSDTPVTLRVTDAAGRMMEARSKLAANSSVQVGANYHAGTYFAEMLQGSQHKVVQLIKLK